MAAARARIVEFPKRSGFPGHIAKVIADLPKRALVTSLVHQHHHAQIVDDERFGKRDVGMLVVRLALWAKVVDQ